MKAPIPNQIRWIALLTLGLLPGQLQASEFLEISAELETYGYELGDRASATKAKPTTFSVTCVAGTNEWRIENTYLQVLQGAEDQWYFDGTNVYNRTRSAVVPDGITKVRDSKDGLPLGHAGVNIPWLAFCSGSYLKREGRVVPLAAALLSNTPDRFAYSDVTTTFDDALGLPRTIDLFTSKSLLLKSLGDFRKEKAQGKRYDEWDKQAVESLQEGVLVFHYAVLETTNILGRTLPARFEFFQTGRQIGHLGNWFCRGVGRVTSIRPSAKPAGLLTAGKPEGIADMRFRDGQLGLRYISTNGFVLPSNDPALLEKVGKRKK